MFLLFQFFAAVNSQLLEYMGYVLFHRGFGNIQLFSNLPVGKPSPYELCHLPLPAAQQGKIRDVIFRYGFIPGYPPGLPLLFLCPAPSLPASPARLPFPAPAVPAGFPVQE